MRCKENLDLAVSTDPSNAEAHHTLASYWLCKGDRQVRLFVLLCHLHELVFAEPSAIENKKAILL